MVVSDIDITQKVDRALILYLILLQAMDITLIL